MSDIPSLLDKFQDKAQKQGRWLLRNTTYRKQRLPVHIHPHTHVQVFTPTNFKVEFGTNLEYTRPVSKENPFT